MDRASWRVGGLSGRVGRYSRSMGGASITELDVDAVSVGMKEVLHDLGVHLGEVLFHDFSTLCAELIVRPAAILMSLQLCHESCNVLWPRQVVVDAADVVVALLTGHRPGEDVPEVAAAAALGARRVGSLVHAHVQWIHVVSHNHILKER